MVGSKLFFFFFLFWIAIVIDFVRCSVCFETVDELYSALNEFIIKVNKSDSGCVQRILRVKNGFKAVLNWNHLNDAEYCDLKINVVIFDKEMKQSMVAEIQLLLQFLLKAKKMGFVFFYIFD